MSKPVSKTLIGVFVVGALALAVAAVMVFGSGKFLTKTSRTVMYFEGSVKGLNIGAPVMFRGVKVGSVTNVELIFDPDKLSFLIPVYVDLDTSKVQTTGKTGDKYNYLEPLVEKGLRAQLESQSFVTGQLMINLDFFPGTPVKVVGLDKRYPEIPTIPSTLEQLSKDIQNLPWKELFESAHAAVKGIDTLVNSPAMGSTVKNMDKTLREATVILQSIGQEMDGILASVKEGTEFVRAAAEKVDKSFEGDRGIPSQVQKTLEAAQKSLVKAEQTLNTVQEIASENSVLAVEAGQTLGEVTKSARSLRVLADYLERHPEALIRGKKAP